METRKIQSVGGGTYTVSLPKEWVESQGIATGDTVNLHTHLDGVLVVQAQECEDDVPGQITIRVDHDDPASFKRILQAAYRSGTKEIILEAEEPFTTEQRHVITQVTRTLTGVSIVEFADTEITVQTLLNTDDVSVRQSVRQLKFVALSMHRNATAILTDDEPSDGLADRDDQADRLYAMIDRSFVRGLTRLDEVDALGQTRPELFELWATARELERVADHAEGIATVAPKREASVEASTADEIQDIAQLACDIVEAAVSVVLGDAAVGAARQAFDTRDQVREATQEVSRRLLESSDTGQLVPVVNRVRRTAEHGGNIAELTAHEFGDGLLDGIREFSLSQFRDEMGEAADTLEAYIRDILEDLEDHYDALYETHFGGRLRKRDLITRILRAVIDRF